MSKSFVIWLWDSGTLIKSINSREGNSSLFTIEFTRYNKILEEQAVREKKREEKRETSGQAAWSNGKITGFEKEFNSGSALVTKGQADITSACGS